MTTVTIPKIGESTIKVALTKAQIGAMTSLALTYAGQRTEIDKLATEIELKKASKLSTILAVGKAACEQKGIAYNAGLALATYDALDHVFCTKLVQIDQQNRVQPNAGKDAPLPEPRDLSKIDLSYVTMRSYVRRAIFAGKRITGTESKNDLQVAAGHNVAPKGETADQKAERGARVPKTGKNVATASDSLASLNPDLAAILKEIGRVALECGPGQQAILADCLVDALGTYKDRIAPPEQAAAPAPVVSEAAPAAPVKARKGRKAATQHQQAA